MKPAELGLLGAGLKMFSALSILTSIFLINSALAAVVQCGTDVCSSEFRIDFNGNQGVGTGEMLYDATTGEISLNTDPTSITGPGMVQNGSILWTMGDGSTISVDSLSGNVDPILSFGLGSTTTASGASFAFAFNLPIAIEGPTNANSSVSYSLTSTTAAGAQIQPIPSTGKVVQAWETDTSVGGIGTLNKGVDVGDTFFFLGGPLTQNSPVYTASNQFTGDLAYDLMAVQVAYSLSPNSSVGLSGFVNQVVVPLPPAVWLFGTGLLGMIGIARTKKAA